MSEATHDDPTLLSVRGIVKKFGGATALGGADFTVKAGEVHALLGANGAGKSTLIKVLAGIYRADAGEVMWRGAPLHLRSIHEATAQGIAVMFQQLNVVEDLTVGQYLSLGRERSRLGFIDKRHSDELAANALASVGVEIPLRRPAASLSVAERELIEIARAVSLDARLVIMDEPTASLGEHEVEQLFEVIRTLKARGVSVVYVSHKLDEVLAITDHCTVLRDGLNAGDIPTSEADKETLLKMMVGSRARPKRAAARVQSDDVVLSISELATDSGLRDISLDLHKGEILGIYGLMGAGRTELLRACYGLDRIAGGSLRLNGRAFRPRSPRAAVRAGVGLVPEDRVREAMFPDASVAANISVAASKRITRGPFFDRRLEREIATDAVRRIGIKVPSVDALIGVLSGGNQQKAVFGRWLAARSRVLLLDDPTVGVDVAAKADIYQIIRSLTESGVSIVVCSSELEELMLLADRIGILHQHRLVDVVDPRAADAEDLIRRSIVGTDLATDTHLREPE